MKHSIKIALAQINCHVGDIKGNADKIIEYAVKAHQQGASMVITPELALCGYPPEDLLFRDDFNACCDKELNRIARSIPAITLVIGHPQKINDKLFNAASVIQNNLLTASYFKQSLPNYSVFDEERYFEMGTEALVFEHAGTKFGVLICADGWSEQPAMLAKQAGAEVLLFLNASPYHIDKLATRVDIFAKRAVETCCSLIYVNMVGGQDELVFDGASFVLNSDGQITHQFDSYYEDLYLVNLVDNQPISPSIVQVLSMEASVYNALKLGLRDYVNKNNFPSVVLGLSGGVDSALTLAIAVDALGAERVKVVLMSSEFTANISVEDALEMASLLNVQSSQIPIKDLYDLYCQTLKPTFGDLPFDSTEENLQARIRGMLLMAMSNKFGSIVLTTGNKSEMAVGYSTLYGDMAGGFSLLKDVPKTLVYKLCRYRNAISNVIPQRILSRAPSAELRADQTDQDSLPPYEILDPIMQAYVEDDLSRDAIVQLGFSQKDVNRVTNLIDKNEYKRRQAAVGVRITQRGFGKDRRYPTTCKLAFD